ncbi:MAG: response regulator, partial [Elusimicrobiota bacterium]|nr:response regulator [Elusimicrobiota bacterium]
QYYYAHNFDGALYIGDNVGNKSMTNYMSQMIHNKGYVINEMPKPSQSNAPKAGSPQNTPQQQNPPSSELYSIIPPFNLLAPLGKYAGNKVVNFYNWIKNTRINPRPSSTSTPAERIALLEDANKGEDFPMSSAVRGRSFQMPETISVQEKERLGKVYDDFTDRLNEIKEHDLPLEFNKANFIAGIFVRDYVNINRNIRVLLVNDSPRVLSEMVKRTGVKLNEEITAELLEKRYPMGKKLKGFIDTFKPTVSTRWPEFTFDFAYGVESTVNKLNSNKYDYVLSDIHLGDGDGYEILEYVKTKVNPNIRVIAYSRGFMRIGYGEFESVDNLIKAGFDGALDNIDIDPVKYISHLEIYGGIEPLYGKQDYYW